MKAIAEIEAPSFGLLTWILIGLVAGFLAELVLGGGQGFGLRGLVVTTLLGVAGAILGGFVSVYFGYGDVTGFNVRSLVIAVCGAIAIIVAYRAISQRSQGRGSRRGLL